MAARTFLPSDPFAVISDIHGNLAALTAVLEDIARQGIHQIVCLGDIIGYGPKPIECLELVRERCCIVIMGNHDDSVGNPYLLMTYNSSAKTTLRWTIRQLSKEQKSYLKHLPRIHREDCFTFVHGSPREGQDEWDTRPRHTFEYLNGRKISNRYSFRKEVFDSIKGLCLVGHTHIPCIYLPRKPFIPLEEIRGRSRSFRTKGVVCVGSVGQPRTEEHRPTYVIVKPAKKSLGCVRFCSVDYDKDETISAINAVTEWPEEIRQRLIWKLHTVT